MSYYYRKQNKDNYEDDIRNLNNKIDFVYTSLENIIEERSDLLQLLNSRSEKTHPIDPFNPKKYRRNGGGVLIAINISLSINSKTIPTNCSAELLAIELAPNKTKIILTTCYRVGTLGMSNCSEILSTLGRLSRKKMLRKFIFIGDFNLKGIDWASGNTRGSIEREFLNGFADLGPFQ